MGNNEEYSEADDSPEAQLYRRQQRREEREQAFREHCVEQLLGELRPEDARRWMPTFDQMRRFDLRFDRWA